jgi:hypothetical protein
MWKSTRQTQGDIHTIINLYIIFWIIHIMINRFRYYRSIQSLCNTTRQVSSYLETDYLNRYYTSREGFCQSCQKRGKRAEIRDVLRHPEWMATNFRAETKKRGCIRRVYNVDRKRKSWPRQFFQFVQRDHGTKGHSLKLFHRWSRLKIRKHSVSNRVIKDWNNLPPSAVDAPRCHRSTH